MGVGWGEGRFIVNYPIAKETNEWNKSDRERQISWYQMNKKWYKWTYLQNRNKPTDFENKLMVTKGERGGGIN